MARTIEVIQASIISSIAADPVLSASFTSTSRTAVWRLICYVVALAIWTLEKLHDIFIAEVNETIDALKPHSLRWYAEKSKAFQYGYDLIDESDKYDNEGIAEDVIEASKIVSYAAVVEQERGVRIKVAKTVGSDLGGLSAGELDSFSAYIAEIKDAGVKTLITTSAADELLLSLHIIYNPLVLNSTGGRIDGTAAAPVKDAIKEHLLNLPFNGVFSLQSLVDSIQAVEGVNDLRVDACQTKYGALPFTTVNISVVPDAGYLRIDDANLNLTYAV